MGIHLKIIIAFILATLLLGIYLKDVPVHLENHVHYLLCTKLFVTAWTWKLFTYIYVWLYNYSSATEYSAALTWGRPPCTDKEGKQVVEWKKYKTGHRAWEFCLRMEGDMDTYLYFPAFS